MYWTGITSQNFDQITSCKIGKSGFYTKKEHSYLYFFIRFQSDLQRIEHCPTGELWSFSWGFSGMSERLINHLYFTYL